MRALKNGMRLLGLRVRIDCVLAMAFLGGALGAQEAVEEEAVASRNAGQDILRLENGDQLAGRLVSASPADGIAWQRGSSMPASRFQYEAVATIDLDSAERSLEPSWSRSLLRMSNGDQLTGRLVEITETDAAFESWYGGVLRLPRDRWQWIVFEDIPEEPLFSGSVGLEGWTVGDVSMARVQSGDWVYHENAFYATKAASIARNLDLPDRSQIEFDLHWKGTLNLAFALYSDYLHPVSLANKDTEPDFGGFYSLQLNSYFANVLMVKQGIPLQYLGQVQTPAFAKKRKAHIDIRVNKAADSIALLVDGELIKQWVDKTGFAGEGTGVRMVHQGQGAIRFANFRVLPWNGQFDEAPSVRSTAKEDLVTLRNGDKLIGDVLTVQSDTIRMSLIGGETDMPLQEVKKIEFAGVADLKPKALSYTNRVSGRFSGAGSIDVDAQAIENNRLTGFSPNFGPVDLDLRAFDRLSLGDQ